MRHQTVPVYILTGLVGSGCAGLFFTTADRAAVAGPIAPDIEGTYELTRRVMSDGTQLRPPTIVALYGLSHGRGNFNLFLKTTDGTLASESTISRYTLTADKYCEWIVYTTRNNLDSPGVTNEAPPAGDHCSPVLIKGGQVVFTPPGEGGVETTFDKQGMTATIKGQFTDYWQKVR